MTMLIKYTNNIEEVRFFESELEFRYYLADNSSYDRVKVIGYKKVK